MMTLLFIWGIVSVAIAGVVLANLRIRVSKVKTKQPVKSKVSHRKRISIKV